MNSTASKQTSLDDDVRQASSSSKMPSFPPIINLYGNYSSGVIDGLTTLKLCGGGADADADKDKDKDKGKGKDKDKNDDDFLGYLVEVHHGFTSRGPLGFRPGFYLRSLRNGKETETGTARIETGTGSQRAETKKTGILAAAGDEAKEPLLMSTFSVKSVIMLPPPPPSPSPLDQLEEDVDEVKNNNDSHREDDDWVTEIMYATTNSDGTVSLRFSIEVGPKMKTREEFEWRKTKNGKKGDNTNNTQKHTRFILIRVPPSITSSSSTSASSPSPSPPSAAQKEEESNEILAELTFRNAMSLHHLFTLELKGAGFTGEMGDRWTLMAVMTALRLYWLRSYGKTNKVVVGIGEKLRG